MRMTMVRRLASASGLVGFVGLGNMGAPMAVNLARHGHRLVAFDSDRDRLMEVSRVAGAVPAETLAEVADMCRVVISMLPSSPQVQLVYQGSPQQPGLLHHTREHTIFIDCSTIDPAVSRMLSSLAHTHGADILDAPVSGGVPGAVAGELTFMVGGPPESLERVSSLLRCMGTRILHLGSSGCGQIAKLCNNLVMGVSMAAVCEAMALAEMQGLDLRKFTEVLNSSSGSCWSSSNYNPVFGMAAKNHYHQGFSCNLMVKDLGLALQAASTVASDASMARAAEAQYLSMQRQGSPANKDFSGLYKYVYCKDR